MGGNASGEACCALAVEMPSERKGTRKVEARRQVRRRRAAMLVEDMVANLGMTSVARHSEPSPTIVLAHIGEANVCTPRPTSSRVTTADGRSPGSRVDTLRRLPRTEIPSGTGRKIHRLQLRGQPRHWEISRTAFPFDPQPRGTVGNYGRSLARSESIPSLPGCNPDWTSAPFSPHDPAGEITCRRHPPVEDP